MKPITNKQKQRLFNASVEDVTGITGVARELLVAKSLGVDLAERQRPFGGPRMSLWDKIGLNELFD